MELTVVGKERLPSRGCDLKNMYIFPRPYCVQLCPKIRIFLFSFYFFLHSVLSNSKPIIISPPEDLGIDWFPLLRPLS